jgi:hypothetical protein
VARTAGVNGAAGVGQVAHQLAGAACMVEMDVCRQHPVDLLAPDPTGVERCEQVRHGQRRARVYERGTSVVQEQVAGIETRPDIVGVDGRDAVRKVRQLAFDIHVAGVYAEMLAWGAAPRGTGLTATSRRAQRLLGVRNPCCAEK